MDEKEKIEAHKEFIKTLEELEGMEDIGKMIKDNKIEFDLDNIKYQVRQPTFEEQKELETFRRHKYVEFMSDSSMMFQKQWIEKYKAKGIDVDEMENQIRKKQNEINKLFIKLAQSSEKERVEELKSEILALRSEMASINIEKADLLSFSIEDQLMIAVNSYYTYLVLEKLENNKYIRVFKSFDEFSKSTNTKLINRAFNYVNSIIYSVGV